MRRVLIAAIVVGAVALSVANAYAAKKVKPALSDSQRKGIAAQAVQSLNSKSWTVYWVLQGAKKPAVMTDIITFNDNSITSAYLIKQGFMGSHYSMHVRDDKAAVWETVQRNENDDLAMIRGELAGGEMVGTVTIRKNSTGASQIYTISTMPPAGMVKKVKTTVKE